MDPQLVSEFDHTLKLIRKLRRELAREGYVVEGQRGANAKNPKADALKDQQTHLRGLARLLKASKTDVPISDDDLAGLLD